MARSRLLWLSGALVVLTLTALSLRLRQAEEIPPLEEHAPLDAGAAESDTAEETLNTLVAEIRVMQQEVQALRDENHALEEQLHSTRNLVEHGGELTQLKSQLRVLEERLDRAPAPQAAPQSSGAAPSAEDSSQPGAWRVPESSWALPTHGEEGEYTAVAARTAHWVAPLDASSPWPAAQSEEAFDAGLRGAVASHTAAASVPHGAALYEIPAHTMLFEARALTALIGRVPVAGAAGPLLPVKLVVRVSARDRLDIPGLHSIIFSGTASGDWGLGCVRVRINGAQYRFSDGATGLVEEDGELGWVSDRWGLPCIPGERFSNAPQALWREWLLALTSGYASAYRETQITRTVSADGTSRSELGGEAYDYAAAEGVSAGLEELRSFFARRLENTFDAVYTPPGAVLVVHLARTMRLRHGTAQRASQGGEHGSLLSAPAID